MKKYNSKFNTHITKLMQNSLDRISGHQVIRELGLIIVTSVLVGENIPCMPKLTKSAGVSEKVGMFQESRSHFK